MFLINDKIKNMWQICEGYSENNLLLHQHFHPCPLGGEWARLWPLFYVSAWHIWPEHDLILIIFNYIYDLILIINLVTKYEKFLETK